MSTLVMQQKSCMRRRKALQKLYMKRLMMLQKLCTTKHGDAAKVVYNKTGDAAKSLGEKRPPLSNKMKESETIQKVSNTVGDAQKSCMTRQVMPRRLFL